MKGISQKFGVICNQGVLPTKREKHTLREIQDKKSDFSYAKE